MIHSVRFTAVLDTNVIYPVIIRDLLLWFAYYDMYTPKWSNHIFDEWKDVMHRKGVPPDESEKRTLNLNNAFPDALVTHYETLIEHLELPDDFLTDIIDLNTEIAIEAFKEMVLNKKNPELDEYEVLNCLRKNGLKDTADYLHALL
jgi:hypothetical protein